MNLKQFIWKGLNNITIHYLWDEQWDRSTSPPEEIWHRDDGPAFIKDRHCHKWYKNGLLHRDDGPAIYFLYDDGETHSHEYCLYGVCVGQKRFEEHKFEWIKKQTKIGSELYD